MFMDSGLAMSMPGVLPNETVDLLDLDKTDIEGTKYYWVPLDQFGLNNVQHVTGRSRRLTTLWGSNEPMGMT